MIKPPLNILLVEAEPFVAHLLRLHLERDTYEVIQAKNVAEAGGVLNQYNISGALVDSLLLVEQLHEVRPEVPVIFLAPLSPTGQDIFQAGKQGAYEYLARPFEAAELLQVVRRA